MKTKTIITASLLALFCIGSGYALAADNVDTNKRGPAHFTVWDADGSGGIDQQEFAAMKEKRQAAVNRGKHRMSKKGGMGCHQAMDAETRQKYDEFIVSTLALRQDIAAKRVEKITIMHLSEPDADKAGRLTRELIELRSQLMEQASEAGITMGHHGMCPKGKGHGGWKKGKGYGSKGL